MKISELMEQLGDCQRVHGDVGVLLGVPLPTGQQYYAGVAATVPVITTVGSLEVQYVALLGEAAK